jgi:hypothetical protein
MRVTAPAAVHETGSTSSNQNHIAMQRLKMFRVGSESKAVMLEGLRDVRFTPESEHPPL